MRTKIEQQKQLIQMVSMIEDKFILSSRVREAFLNIPRDIFIPQGMLHIAYKLDALPLGTRQFISSPLTVAKMTQYLELESCDSILEVGLGSGYQAAILSKIVRRVFSIERINRLRDEAIERFRLLNIMNVNTKLDDGKNGWDRFAPFDRILFSASLKEIPLRIISQLCNGGIIVAPILKDDGSQVITRFIKHNDMLEILDMKDNCSFVIVRDNIE
ncbi:protein-L-isoaspartate(D-aspartate) O-methyltransferase [Helicobacter sp. MIT 14-3879]|uniref:protein-L-isoaspartate(D-aspartate) O-methyltransferase n=1 Tax=Helicobacter sp. MIT 14-3879 TaxID=2040649 RepID=UPI000E1F4D94|nr:protein-L-isoaspartate(D-aspartate) O-methyltransferase [Helicobacter sp. MIT 14-3879]RDU63962.1 protein-L-isoaspartate O-methyltransferase [Helicobacter sp. MIT 14-3879]